MSWYTSTNDGVILSLHIVPRSSKTCIDGLHGDALKIRLQAPPVDGKANRMLLKFLAKTINIPAAHLQLVAGESSRQKRVHLCADAVPAFHRFEQQITSG
ncbi:MAG: YggU family protein [Spartobacteria bacterium]|nr:YggU family protein [Spartobacteria bacterium]